MKITIHDEKEGDWALVYRVEQKYSTRPYRRCQDSSVENPLLEPMKIKGGTVKKQVEATFDYRGHPLVTTAGEPLRGPEVQFDDQDHTVTISQNVLSLGLPAVVQMLRNPLNASPLWGMAARCVKFSSFQWERNVYGTCAYYYTRTFEFEINFDTWDRVVPNRGTMAMGHWNADGTSWVHEDKPQVYKDKNGENTICFLDASGDPVTDPNNVEPLYIYRYGQSNLLLLGLPTSL
jgi:hypothetical protein